MAIIPEALQQLGSNLPLPTGDQLRMLFSSELLTTYLQRCILEAIADQAPDSAAAEEQLARLMRQLGLKDVEALDLWCQQYSVSLSALQQLATFPLRLQVATETIWADDVPGRFLERRSSLDQATLSVLRFDDADLAQELYFQMLDGDTVFAQLVDRFGDQPGQPARALIGPVSLDQLHPLLARVAERYAPGAVIPPLELNGTAHLIRVERLQKACLDDAMRQRLLLELRQQWLDQELNSLLGRLALHTPDSTALAATTTP